MSLYKVMCAHIKQFGVRVEALIDGEGTVFRGILEQPAGSGQSDAAGRLPSPDARLICCLSGENAAALRDTFVKVKGVDYLVRDFAPTYLGDQVLFYTLVLSQVQESGASFWGS